MTVYLRSHFNGHKLGTLPSLSTYQLKLNSAR